MAEAVARVLAAPGELRAAHESVEEAAVEVIEKFFEMVVVPASRVDVLASAHLAYKARFGGEIVSGDIAAVTRAVRAIDGLAVKLGQQDVRDGVKHGFRRSFKQIGKADVEFRLAKADGVIDRYKRVEAKMHGRCGRARAKLGVGFLKNAQEIGGHVECRVSMRAPCLSRSAR